MWKCSPNLGWATCSASPIRVMFLSLDCLDCLDCIMLIILIHFFSYEKPAWSLETLHSISSYLDCICYSCTFTCQYIIWVSLKLISIWSKFRRIKPLAPEIFPMILSAVIQSPLGSEDYKYGCQNNCTIWNCTWFGYRVTAPSIGRENIGWDLGPSKPHGDDHMPKFQSSSWWKYFVPCLTFHPNIWRWSIYLPQ